jgi:dihydroflavonol-4-reductase
MASPPRVLVTGGSGYIASYIIAQLLAEGYEVRTTVRSLGREPQVREHLAKITPDLGKLSFFAADLTSDTGWAEAVESVDFIQHIASPVPATLPKNDDELVIPAREGALRALRFGRDAGVRRVVMTSSMAATAWKGRRLNRWMKPIGPTRTTPTQALISALKSSLNARLGHL